MKNFVFFQIPGTPTETNLFWYFIWASIAIFVVVVFFIAYYSIKYKAKSQDETPPQLHGNRKVEISLLFLSTVIVAIFFVLTVNAMNTIQDIPKHPNPDLRITGHQWWWEAHYPHSGVIASNEIHIPAGKKILLQVNSADVIHDWWVPKLGRKIDMFPGMDNYVWMYAPKPGTYLGTCSEFCGTQHAHMRIRVIAQNKKDFKKWQEHQLKPALPVSKNDSLVKEGKALFMSKTCVKCHQIRGTKATANIGPDLTHFASRIRILSDMKTNTKTHLRQWLKNPQKVKPGAHMPNFIFTNRELKALTSYIHHLK